MHGYLDKAFEKNGRKDEIVNKIAFALDWYEKFIGGGA